MTNPFATEQAWEVGGVLGEGNHACKVISVDGSGTSSGGYPQIEVKVGNGEGAIRDWIVIIPATVGKVLQFVMAAGAARPEDADVTQEGAGFRLSPLYLKRLEGKDVGVIVRSEPDRNDPTKLRDRVQGYVPTSELKPYTNPFVAGQSDIPTTTEDDDIPF